MFIKTGDNQPIDKIISISEELDSEIADKFKKLKEKLVKDDETVGVENVSN